VLIPKETIELFLVAFEERWSSLSVSVGDAGGGTEVVVRASALTTSASTANYKCVFTAGALQMESELAMASSPSQVTCTTPSWGQLYAAQRTSLTLKNIFTDAVVEFTGAVAANTFEFTASWVRAQEVTVSSSGDTLNIIGVGFDIEQPYRCSLTKNAHSITSFGANPLSPTTFACATPSWGSFYEASTVVVEVVLEDGSLLAFSGELGYKNVALLETWVMVNVTTTAASGSTALSLTGFGFEATSQYVCKLQTISMADHWQNKYLPDAWSASARRNVQTVASNPVTPTSLKTLSCTVPEWGTLYAAASVAVVLTRHGETLQFVGKSDA
jgi:hypothetical protein